ncbi:RCC1 domain-containing protein [Actinoplanes sp. RD1]|uniref:RCC1 domain-containing protein n=1 Tax=Actinoplanes sp. RD1 TaxID=3064538 RepID=UPI0027407464|nr:hypothetical protein [Actinoplanes sp. RD1]
MSVRRVIAALAVTMLVALTLSGSPSGAAFSVTTLNQANTYAADGPYGPPGALWSWGDTGDAQLTPARIGTDSTWASVASGDHYTCGVQTPGSLWCWGSVNTSGQQGSGDTTARQLPTRVGTAAWTQVAAGASHTCGIQSDQTLWCWGDGSLGKLGQGSTTGYTAPRQVTSPAATGWASVATGNQFTCATRTDGTLYCFGRNGSGEIGIGTTSTSQATPAQVTSPAATGWTKVALGYQHVCALRTGNSLYCWGDGGGGRLGTGTTTGASVPQPVTGSWAGFGLGTDHTCGIKTGGTLWCWGVGADGRLGTGTTTDRSTPAQVGTATTWRTATGSHYATCGTQTDDSLWCWGDNAWGQAGVGDTTDRTTPVQAGTGGWPGAGPGPIGNQFCAVRADATMWCWGDLQAVRFTAYRIGPEATWTSASSGDRYSCGTRTDGSLWCWGVNTSGRLGVGDTTARYSPARVGTASMWKQVATGAQHACAVGTDSTLWCWGANGSGQLGIGSTTGYTTPQPVTSPAATGWAAVTAGNLVTCATRIDGTLYCFGRNSSGEVGNGTTATSQPAPAPVTTPAATGWATVSVGFQHACAVRTDRSLWCWGDGGGGRLGVGSTASSSTPRQVADATWLAVGLGTDHSCAVRDPGTLWCWGTGAGGRLGTGTTADRTTPAQVGTATSWVTVSGGSSHTCGTRAFGTVWCWGVNSSGQLGLGSGVAQQLTPAQVTGVLGRPVASGPVANAAAVLTTP